MTATEIKQKLNAQLLVDSGQTTEDEVYAGDFLSRVISKAPARSIWLTVMDNVNVAGVAVLADIGAIVLCEGVLPGELLLSKCEAEGITLLSTTLPVAQACVKLLS